MWIMFDISSSSYLYWFIEALCILKILVNTMCWKSLNFHSNLLAYSKNMISLTFLKLGCGHDLGATNQMHLQSVLFRKGGRKQQGPGHLLHRCQLGWRWFGVGTNGCSVKLLICVWLLNQSASFINEGNTPELDKCSLDLS